MNCSILGLGLFGDSESSHQLRQALTRDAEFLRSSRPMPACPDERRANEPFFEGSARVVQPHRVGEPRFSKLRSQSGRRDDATLGAAHDERRQHILELSNVAGPVVARQRGQ